MNKIAVFSFAVLLIMNVNGNATEIATINLVSFDNSLSVEKKYDIETKTTSEPKLGQGISAVPEPAALLILGLGLMGFGLFWRKILSHRCLTCAPF